MKNDHKEDVTEETVEKSSNLKEPSTEASHNSESSDATDGRKRYQWETGYPPVATKVIKREFVYLASLLALSHLLIFLTWLGWVNNQIPTVTTGQAVVLKKYLYYAFSGLLGGVAFDMKYFYRSVARGFWHQDRLFWRLLSPFLSMTVAVIVGAMIDCSLIPSEGKFSGPTILVTGFLSGYFADQAIGKMAEVAMILFGKNSPAKK